MKKILEESKEYKTISNLVLYLTDLRKEGTWYEFKENYYNEKIIGDYISALSNAAAIEQKEYGYMIWGVNDTTYEIVGTTFDPDKHKVGNQDLEIYLNSLIDPHISIDFFELFINNKRIVVLRIEKASVKPTSFNGVEKIRVGSNRANLKDYPKKEAEIWESFRVKSFENEVALDELNVNDIFNLLDTHVFFEMIDLPYPNREKDVIESLIRKDLIRQSDNGTYIITNCGALLIARDLNKFPKLIRKSIRVIEYENEKKTSAIGETIFKKGYLLIFEDVLTFIMGLMKKSEDYSNGLRNEKTRFPFLAIREALGNIIAHQDLTNLSKGPVIEVHPTFIDFINPGNMIIDPLRIIDATPESFNICLTDVLHLAHILEERGQGFDVMEETMGSYHLPSPIVTQGDNYTIVSLIYYPVLNKWPNEFIIKTIYLFCCYNAVNKKETSNSDIRERLNIDEKNAAMVSRKIKEAVESGLIKISNPSSGIEARKYIPFWL